MPLPAALSQCLSDLAAHCSALNHKLETAQLESMTRADSARRSSIEADMEVLCLENAKLKQRLGDLELQLNGGLLLPGASPLAEDKQSSPMISAVHVPLIRTGVMDSAWTSFGEPPEMRHLAPEGPSSTAVYAGNMVQPRTKRIVNVGHHMLQEKVRAQAVNSKTVRLTDDQPLAISKMGSLTLKGDPLPNEEEEGKDKFRSFKETVMFLLNTDAQGDAAQRLASGAVFETVSMSMILANTLYLGAAADFNVKNSYQRLQGVPMKDGSNVLRLFFPVWFVIELLVRLAAERKQFFKGQERWWNIFDVGLVLESIVSSSVKLGTLSYLRILRVFRIVRIVRLVRTVKALKRLRTMIFALINSMVDLIWALLVVALICFVFSIIFNNAVAAHFDGVKLSDVTEMAKAHEVQAEFGSLYNSMTALWSAVSGGNDWMHYGVLIRKITDGELYFLIFNFYIAFCIVGMFNVVTGVFVDSAVCTRTQDEIVQGYLEGLRTMTVDIKEILRDADTDKSGSLSFDEFQKHMQNPEVKAYFNGIDIDPDESKVIFRLLDSDNSGDIQIEELVNGTMKLKGYATKLDMMTMMYDCTRQSLKLDSLCDFMETQLKCS